MTPQERAELVADEIVASLFMNGAGQAARRLVLELDDGRNGGGWSAGPVKDVIVRVLLSGAAKDVEGAVGGWRGIKSAPKENDVVLVWTGKNFRLAVPWMGSWFLHPQNLRMRPRPTHWQPLPAPPTAEVKKLGSPPDLSEDK